MTTFVLPPPTKPNYDVWATADPLTHFGCTATAF